MFAYDDKLMAAVQGAPQSVDDVIRTMQAIDAICPDGDGLKWFNWLYLGVTLAVVARVDAGGFRGKAWRLLEERTGLESCPTAPSPALRKRRT